jgi:hypothetical protein
LSDTIKEPKAETFKIYSNRLAVELAYPGSSIQKGARFDLSGQVVQVVLDGKHVFCAPESMDENRGSGGLGLCNEFIDTTHTMYNEVGSGEKFPKMGVGLLTRESGGDYFFMTHYEKTPYPMEVSINEESAQFTVLPAECMGFAARLEKKVSVHSNQLQIDYVFENAGQRPIEVVEYNHNFVCIDHHDVGPDYRFTLPYDVKLDKCPEVLSVDGGEITWKGVPEQAFFCMPEGFAGVAPHSWEVVHEPSGVGMREIDDFPVDHLALWGMSHVVSAEVFIKVSLNPGESHKWSRRYEFFSPSHA